ncbi:MAG: hypothetical protein M1815_003537 [Lichina confinis]|nr:MAG: hypothetical protein M1815_003537 [Lichina confinis]
MEAVNNRTVGAGPEATDEPQYTPSHPSDSDDDNISIDELPDAADQPTDPELVSRWSRNTSSLLLAEASTASGPSRILRGMSQRLHRRTRSLFAWPAAKSSNQETRAPANVDVRQESTRPTRRRTVRDVLGRHARGTPTNGGASISPGFTEGLNRTNRRHSLGDLLTRQPHESPSGLSRAATITVTTTITTTTDPINRRRPQRDEQYVATRQNDAAEQDVPADTPIKPWGLRRAKTSIARRTKSIMSKIGEL